MDNNLPFTIESWLSSFLPEIQKQLNIPDDDQSVVNYWYKEGLRSQELEFNFLSDKDKIVCFAAGPSLVTYTKYLDEINRKKIAVCSADGATRWLVEQGCYPDYVATDLDGLRISMIDELLEYGVQLQVLTHGDNYEKVKNLLNSLSSEKLSQISFSTQGKPHLGWKNTLGFTDGDRLVCSLITKQLPLLCLGYDLNADEIGRYSKPEYLHNMPMNNRKKAKLQIAMQIFQWISNHFTFYAPDNRLPMANRIDSYDFLRNDLTKTL